MKLYIHTQKSEKEKIAQNYYHPPTAQIKNQSWRNYQMKVDSNNLDCNRQVENKVDRPCKYY